MNRRLQYLMLALCSITVLAACASAPPMVSSGTPALSPKPTFAKKPSPLRSEPSLYKNDVGKRLLRHYKDWRGTPYQFGGSGRRGVDCSGFVQLTFRQVLGVELPRTTAQQMQAGRRVAAKQVAVGDLVFFDTGQRHVGIYIGDGKFMHASTSRGVTTSSMHSPYWSRTFRYSRRIYFN